jgi:hypothetical protein
MTMQFIKTLVRLLIILGLPAFSYAQSTFLPQGSKFEHFLDRMEILQQRDAELNITTDKPVSRRMAVRLSELADSMYKFYPYDEIYHISNVANGSPVARTAFKAGSHGGIRFIRIRQISTRSMRRIFSWSSIP